MSCGSPLGDLLYLADALLERSRSPLAPAGQQGGPVDAGPCAQLYQLYGDGLIADDVFAALRTLADHGQLRPADLAVQRARARRRPPSDADSAAANALRGVRSRLAQLAQARRAAELVLTDLDSRLAGMGERISRKERAAREALAVESDEASARRRLEEKAEFARSRDRLGAQAQALRADLGWLDDLQAQLEARAAELAAVQARSDLRTGVSK